MTSPNDDEDDEDDPFACFDDTESSNEALPKQQRRDDECGVLAFHAGTEYALLTHVENQVQTTPKNPLLVLQVIDEFCLERHWMMHVGPEKAATIQSFLLECISRAKNLSSSSSSILITVVELGTYCGYSSIVMANTLQQQQSNNINFHIYTVDVNPKHLQVARRLIELSGLDQSITALELQDDDDSTDLLSLLKSHNVYDIDFLFIDHDKGAYLIDIQSLEAGGFIRKGTYVAADNVLFHQIDDYRNHVGRLALNGVVETKLVEGQLEYCEPQVLVNTEESKEEFAFRDGIELTVYLKDPDR